MSFFGEITSKEHYGLRLAIRLAETFKTKKPISLAEISELENISMKYLEHLIVPIKKAKWVESVRGREGGYLIIKDPHKITLKDLIDITSQRPYVIGCLATGAGRKKCPLDCSCKSKNAWKKVQEALFKSMEDIKFSQLIDN